MDRSIRTCAPLTATFVPLLIASCAACLAAEPCETKHALPPVSPIVASPVVWSVAAAPIVPVLGTDGNVHVIYELRLTNVTTDPVRVTSMQIVDASQLERVLGENHVVAVDGADVAGRFRRLGFKLEPPELAMSGADYTDRLAPGQSGLAYFNFTFSNREEIPSAIATRISMERGQLQDSPVKEIEPLAQVETVEDLGSATGGLAEIAQRHPIVLSPPLKGDHWVDGDGCCRIIGPHRYTVLPIGGTQRPPEHYAIDFIQLDANGRAWEGDPSKLSNWVFYGADVIAAAPGKVVEVRDGLPDVTPGGTPPGITFDEAAGNHVIVDMGDGLFAMYAHLVPHSIPVSVGQSLVRGQLLGKLGNSGNTDAPHLHFQVMDRPSALDADGLPFVFDHMTLEGRLIGTLQQINASTFAGTPIPIDRSESGLRSGQMPMSLDVLSFH